MRFLVCRYIGMCEREAAAAAVGMRNPIRICISFLAVVPAAPMGRVDAPYIYSRALETLSVPFRWGRIPLVIGEIILWRT